MHVLFLVALGLIDGGENEFVSMAFNMHGHTINSAELCLIDVLGGIHL